MKVEGKRDTKKYKEKEEVVFFFAVVVRTWCVSVAGQSHKKILPHGVVTLLSTGWHPGAPAAADQFIIHLGCPLTQGTRVLRVFPVQQM